MASIAYTSNTYQTPTDARNNWLLLNSDWLVLGANRIRCGLKLAYLCVVSGKKRLGEGNTYTRFGNEACKAKNSVSVSLTHLSKGAKSLVTHVHTHTQFLTVQ